MFDNSANPKPANAEHDSPIPAPRAHWGAVFALTLCVGTLIASEFMPVSLLTPIALDLRMTEGMAGQALAISGLFAVLTSLSISTLTKRVDRRIVLLGLTCLMLISALMVTFAFSYALLMAGRAVLGIVIGGFWSMSAATVMRLVPKTDVPRALAILNGGNALATTLAAPLGSFLGQFIGWRGAFFVIAPLALLTLAWQWLTVPSLPSDLNAGKVSALGFLGHPKARRAMLAVILLFMGQFALFTYLRPFLESVTRVNINVLSIILLLIGASGILGNVLFARVLSHQLFMTLAIAPLVMAAIAGSLILLGADMMLTALFLMLWGLVGTALPVAWWTWLSQTFPDDAEAAGGLMVAVIQLAITLGAAGGGLLYDLSGYKATFTVSTLLLAMSAIVFAVGLWRKTPSAKAQHTSSDKDQTHVA